MGLAWDVTGKGTSVVHAGASVVTDDGIPMFLFVGQGGGAEQYDAWTWGNPYRRPNLENGVQVGTFGGNINYAVNRGGRPAIRGSLGEPARGRHRHTPMVPRTSVWRQQFAWTLPM